MAEPSESIPAGAPPAAIVVTQSPRELELERDLAAEKERVRQAELAAAESQDRYQQLRDIDTRRPMPGTPAKTKSERVALPTILHEAEYDEEETGGPESEA